MTILSFKYSVLWHFEFSPTKCCVIICGKDTNPRINVTMLDHNIQVSACENHLGLILANSNQAELEYFLKRIHQCKSILYATKAIGSRNVPVTPVVASKLYNDVCIPKLLYGCEVMNVGESCLDKLEDFHLHAAKNVQNLPDAAANPACLATLGWSPISSLIDMMRLMFLWRMLLLPVSNIYKKLFIKKLICVVSNNSANAVGPDCNLISVCKKYDVLDFVLKAVTTGEYVTISEWKER